MTPPRLALLLLLSLCLPRALRAADAPLRQTIDAEVQAAWSREKVAPAPRSSDAEFLRRVHLDLVGGIPTHAEAAAFLADADPKKREKLTDRLLADARFAAHQAAVWDLVLFGRNPPNGEATRRRDGFKKWLTEQLARNRPYNQWVNDLLLAEQDGTELFHVQYRNQPEEAAVAVGRIFLGTQLQCARCHDHPYETWTQRDFYGMAGFFVRLVVLEKGSGQARRFTIGEKSSGDVLFTGAAKDRKPGQKGEPIKPRFLGGAALDEPALPAGFKEPDYRTAKTLPKPAFSRKQKLAAWVTAKDNPWFARAAVNRLWAQYLGRGLVHPVDDLSDKNPPSHPELFKTMTRELVAREFDLKWMIRELVLSETYQLAGAGASKESLPAWFERARVRPLSAEELLLSIRTATGAVAGAGDRDGTADYFLRYFGEPTNGRGEFQGGLAEHLFLNNSSQFRQLIARRKGNLADTLAGSSDPWERRVDRLFLSVLSRPPSKAERDRFLAHLSADTKTDALIEEAIWALLNTGEFRFNH